MSTLTFPTTAKVLHQISLHTLFRQVALQSSSEFATTQGRQRLAKAVDLQIRNSAPGLANSRFGIIISCV